MTRRPRLRRLRRLLRPLKRAATGPGGVLLGLALRASGRKPLRQLGCCRGVSRSQRREFLLHPGVLALDNRKRGGYR